MYIAIDQHGQHYHLQTANPRKELLELLGRKHAEKMYVDTIDGQTKHIGYIIGGLWLRVYGLEGRKFGKVASRFGRLVSEES